MNDLLCSNPLIKGMQDAGVRLTAQRIAIAQWLHHSGQHPTSREVHAAMLEYHPTMSLATVYNTLSLLVELDLIHEVGSIEDGSMRYEPNNSPHINLVCKGCGTILDDFAFDMSAVKASAAAHNFAVHDASITVHGLCEACATQQGDISHE